MFVTQCIITDFSASALYKQTNKYKNLGCRRVTSRAMQRKNEEKKNNLPEQKLSHCFRRGTSPSWIRICLYVMYRLRHILGLSQEPLLALNRLENQQNAKLYKHTKPSEKKNGLKNKNISSYISLHYREDDDDDEYYYDDYYYYAAIFIFMSFHRHLCILALPGFDARPSHRRRNLFAVSTDAQLSRTYLHTVPPAIPYHTTNSQSTFDVVSMSPGHYLSSLWFWLPVDTPNDCRHFQRSVIRLSAPKRQPRDDDECAIWFATIFQPHFYAYLRLNVLAMP